ncbi:MAG: hypothetical protein JXR94_20070 [Candidatus Hydrogenedentes bacterium]|nr:hypothetical protein [Candidatus Hydrogenedentota bacterium]
MDARYQPLLDRVTPRERRATLVLEASYRIGAFDSHAVDCPFPFWHAGRYRMTFVGFDGIGYQTGIAESEDLERWENKRLLIGRGEEGSFRQYNFALTWIVRDTDLFGTGELEQVDGMYVGTYHAYPMAGYERGPASIGFCRSADLEHWEIDPPSFHAKDGADWERGGLYKSCLLRHEGVFYMFYNAKTTASPWVEQTGLATSVDLKRWERHGASPVLRLGPKGAFDDIFASDPCVLRAGDVWVMFYFGNSTDGHARDGVAFSDDLIHWDKAPGPILDVGPEGSIDSRYAHKPGIIHRDGRLYHFYCAVAPEPAGRIGEIATSERRGIGLATGP